MAQDFKPVKLVNSDGRVRVARSADEETNYRYNGYRSAPKDKPKPSAPAADVK